MSEPLKIAVGRDNDGWDRRFTEALDEKAAAGHLLTYELVNVDAHDWLEKVRPFDLILWKPDTMGVAGSSHFKEKIYFLEHYLGKLVVPNYSTIWHFESKVAQSYLFALEGVPAPETMVTFDEKEAGSLISSLRLPAVFKRSQGAASKNVRLVRSRRQAQRLSELAFCAKRYKRARTLGGPRERTFWSLARHRWFWDFVVRHLLGQEAPGHIYFQEFIAGNEGDLRIAVIGDCYAYGFWRKNRPDDFRASGSGRIDLETPIPEGPLRYCLDLSRRMAFDSMAFDILFRGDRFVINEMSYGYLDTVPHRTSGHYELDGNGRLTFVPGHVWPQSLWVSWALQKAARLGLPSSG